MIPDEGQALALHRKYGSNERVVNHCRVVTDAATRLAERFREKGVVVDYHAILAGALLHDIGRSRVQTVHHGYVGAQILESEGVDRSVVEIVRRHVGAGISNDEASSLGFPSGADYVPNTLDEKIVCFADKMVSSDGLRPFSEEERRFVRKGHDVTRLRRLKSDLEEALGEDPETVVLAGIGRSPAEEGQGSQLTDPPSTRVGPGFGRTVRRISGVRRGAKRRWSHPSS